MLAKQVDILLEFYCLIGQSSMFMKKKNSVIAVWWATLQHETSENSSVNASYDFDVYIWQIISICVSLKLDPSSTTEKLELI